MSVTAQAVNETRSLKIGKYLPLAAGHYSLANGCGG
jgi:hypothetical protein